MAAQQPNLLDLSNLTTLQLFPRELPVVHMRSIFGGGPVPDLLGDIVPNDIQYLSGRPYVRARTTVFARPSGQLSDDFNSTKGRARLYYWATIGSMRIFDPSQYNDYDKIVSRNILTAWSTSTNNPSTATTPAADHWAKEKPNGTKAPRSWFVYASFLLAKERDDIKRNWLEVASKVVWPAIIKQTDPQVSWEFPQFWSTLSQTPDRVVAVMLSLIRQDSQNRPRIIKFLLGSNRNHIDIDALYAAYFRGNIITITSVNLQGNLILMLVEQIEDACAHMLNQVLQHYVLRNEKKNVLPNLMILGTRSQASQLLEANVGEFPVRPE